ncbi:response regulator [soil metagenome]
MNNIVAGAGIDRSRHKILVVDDNPATRYSTARTFRAAGFKTAEATSGGEALSMSAEGISAVVLDVHLPDIDGFEVCRRWREDPKTALLPVLHLSAAYIEDADKVEGLNSGADAYLTHPAEPPILVATVQALIRARLAEDQLRRSEAKYRAIYAGAESGIALVDSSGAFVEANPAMLRMLGRAAEQVIGQNIWEFAVPQSAQLVRSLFEREDAAGSQWREVFSFTVPDNDDVYLEWTMSQNIEPGLRVCMVNNISAQMRFQEQRESLLNREKAARIVAEQHSQTKDNFIAILSHELRNPLNAILMAVNYLLERGATPEAARGLQMIKRNVTTQARIIADILDMSRINSGKMTLERELIDPRTLIADAIEGMKSSIDQRQLAVTLDTDSAHGLAWLDATRFQQIFWNIFNNAIKFSERGGSIEVSLVKTEGMLTLVVQDHGKGIEAEFLKTIFDKFTQGATPGNRFHGGLGLGMTIVNQLTHLHGGTVSVESEGPGQGAKVTVAIPTAPVSQTDEKLNIELQERDPDANLSGMTILVVEDEPQNREMLTLVLKDRGARVRTAGSYDEALQSLAEARPDLIVSDIGLPGRDGYDLMLEIRRQESAAPGLEGLPAIALTAFARSEDIARAHEVGFNVHVAKPLNMFDLVSAIKSLKKISGAEPG